MTAGRMTGQIDSLGIETVFVRALNQVADRGSDIFGLRRVAMRRRQSIAHQRHCDPVAGQIGGHRWTDAIFVVGKKPEAAVHENQQRRLNRRPRRQINVESGTPVRAPGTVGSIFKYGGFVASGKTRC